MKSEREHTPLVTVYLATKNRLSLLQRALKSLEDQTYRNLELIVVDDGSEDGTSDFLNTYASAYPFHFVSFDQSGGAPAARNYAIHRAQGEFITGLDDDDRFLPDRVARFVQEWHDGISLLGAESFLVTDTRRVRWRKPSVVTYDDLLYRNLIGNQVFTKTAYMRQLKGFDEHLDASQDYDMWLRLVRKYGPARIINEPLQLVSVKSSRSDRITANLQANWGYYSCYLKHRPFMKSAHRRYHVYNIRTSRGKQYTLCESLANTPIKFWKKELGRLFKK
ncbi:MAG: glycosyltransferase [Bacteroidetes bacterium]|nr:glycosyltransferase [Bacteroidota bacterium]MCH8523555.1 glycosyltransferase [Balneolales bacterium]